MLASGAPDAASKVLGQLRLQVAKKQNLIPEGKWELMLGHRLPAVRLERRREALGLGEPPVHGAARGRPAHARIGSGQGAARRPTT